MSDDKKPFTVTDRRHFTTDGESRPAEDEAPVATVDRAPVAPASAQAAPAEDDLQDDAPEGIPIPADFRGLVLSLFEQGGMLLGLGPEQREPALEGVRGVVSLLEMLQE